MKLMKKKKNSFHFRFPLEKVQHKLIEMDTFLVIFLLRKCIFCIRVIYLIFNLHRYLVRFSQYKHDTQYK